MKKYFIIGLLLIGLFFNGFSQDPSEKFTKVILKLSATNQTVTTDWESIGTPTATAIDTRGFYWLKIWIKMDWNAGLNLRIRFIDKLTSTIDVTDNFTPCIIDSSASVGFLEPDYLEFNVDGDGVRYRTITIPLNQATWYIIPQIQMETDGGADPVLLKCWITKG